MKRLPFLDRDRELKRLKPVHPVPGSLSVVYGRRRIGKTRLIQEAVKGSGNAVFYTGDERETPLQIRALASAKKASELLEKSKRFSAEKGRKTVPVLFSRERVPSPSEIRILTPPVVMGSLR